MTPSVQQSAPASDPAPVDEAGVPAGDRAVSTVGFLLRAMLWHSVTYLVAGLLASNLLDYRGAFDEPVIRAYMKPFDSAGVGFGPWLQPLRGLLLGVVLLPWRDVLARPRGWLPLWGLFLGLGILGTPAASPSSLEGLLYSQLPLWYHLFGLPEVCLQTLAFSVLLHRSLRPRDHLPPLVRRLVAAVAGACFAFIGYAAVSIAFAFAVGAGFQSEGALTLKTQGMFIAPLLLNAGLVFFGPAFGSRGLVAGVAWVGNAVVILAYQGLVFGAPGWSYGLIAPIVPAVITAFVARPRR